MTNMERAELSQLIAYHSSMGFTKHIIVAPVSRPELVGKEVLLNDKWYPIELGATNVLTVRSE